MQNRVFIDSDENIKVTDFKSLCSVTLSRCFFMNKGVLS